MTFKVRFLISLTCLAIFAVFVIINSPPREVTIYVAPAGTHIDTATIYSPEFEKKGIELNIVKFPDIVNVKTHVGKEPVHLQSDLLVLLLQLQISQT